MKSCLRPLFSWFSALAIVLRSQEIISWTHMAVLAGGDARRRLHGMVIPCKQPATQQRTRWRGQKVQLIVSLLLGSVLAGTALAAPEGGDNSLLGPGDSVRVTVFQNPDLTTEARLSPEGTLRMPLIGEVSLTGLGTADAGRRIGLLYQQYNILNDPEVVVSRLQIRSRQVSVLGQVARPGRYPLDEGGEHLIDVLALAGGVTPAGDDMLIVLSHRGGEAVQRQISVAALLAGNPPATNLLLGHGDTVFVARAPVFYIYGEVQRPGAYRLEEALTVMQAMALGGGITRRGTERGIRIHRSNGQGVLVKLEATPYDRVQADDVIYINESLF